VKKKQRKKVTGVSGRVTGVATRQDLDNDDHEGRGRREEDEEGGETEELRRNQNSIRLSRRVDDARELLGYPQEQKKRLKGKLRLGLACPFCLVSPQNSVFVGRNKVYRTERNKKIKKIEKKN
jgi:hypothetical protein